MVAIEKPSVKALVALKNEHTEHDPDFLHGIHNQLGALSVTKHGNPRGYGFVRSVKKVPRNQFEMLMVTQMLALHDAAMNSSKSLGEARSLEEINCYGNMFSKLTRSFASHMQTLHQCRSGGEAGPATLKSTNGSSRDHCGDRPSGTGRRSFGNWAQGPHRRDAGPA
jgi:hypothetical protein